MTHLDVVGGGVYRRTTFKCLAQQGFLQVRLSFNVVAHRWRVASRPLFWRRRNTTLIEIPTAVLPRISRSWLKTNQLKLQFNSVIQFLELRFNFVSSNVFFI